MNTRQSAVVTVLLAAAVVPVAKAVIINVPADQPTILVAITVAHGGTYEFEGCGVLELDFKGCVVYQDSTFPFLRLSLEEYGPFEVGEVVHVRGYFERCVSFCTISGCLRDNCISLCPDECPFCPWDLDDDGMVGITDFLELLAAWGTDPFGAPDFDGDDQVGITDFLELLANWGPCP